MQTLAGSNIQYDTPSVTSYHAGLVAEVKLTDGFFPYNLNYCITTRSDIQNATEFKNELGIHLFLFWQNSFKQVNVLILDHRLPFIKRKETILINDAELCSCRWFRN
jgi:hypothetical protein